MGCFTRGWRIKYLLILPIIAITFGCATLTNEPNVPVALSFSDGSYGECKLSNKRGAWVALLPTTMSIRRSDDDLKYDCETEDGRKAFGSIPSSMGGKIVASAVFLDFGIVDSITDKHRDYPSSFVIPIGRDRGREVDNNTSNEMEEEIDE